MNADLMTVLSMRQKEMAYQQLALAAAKSAPVPTAPLMPAPGGFGFAPGATPATPSFVPQSPVPTLGKLRSADSPDSVGQLPYSLNLLAPPTAAYEQFGFTWLWIMDVAVHFALQRQTAHLANQYAQVLLRRRAAHRGVDMYALRNYDDVYAMQRELRILGLACVFMAAKIEEVHPPKAADLAAFISDRGGVVLAGEDLVKLEAEYVTELKWNLHPTTPYAWLLFMVAGGSADQRPLGTMGDFVNPSRNLAGTKELFVNAIRLVDIGLLDYQALEYWPSVLAGAALLLVDPALDFMFVAQFLQLDPNMLWECKGWLYSLSYAVGDLECATTSRDKDRWAKLPDEEYLFVQSPVVIPNHLAGGLLRPENTTYLYPITGNSMVNGTVMGSYTCAGLGGFPSPMMCASPCSPSENFAVAAAAVAAHYPGGNYDVLHSHGGVGNIDGMLSHDSAGPHVYHFKYGWQGVDPALLSFETGGGMSNQDGFHYP